MKKIFLFTVVVLMNSCEVTLVCEVILSPGSEMTRANIRPEEFQNYKKEIEDLNFEVYCRKFYLDKILTPKIKAMEAIHASGEFVSTENINSLSKEKQMIKYSISEKHRRIKNLEFCLTYNVSFDRKNLEGVTITIILWVVGIFCFLIVAFGAIAFAVGASD